MHSPTGIHHITVVVRDLEAAIDRYARALNVEGIIREDLTQRGVISARFRIGDTWLVLVQPTRDDLVPGRHLRDHGEGVMLVSLGVADLAESTASVHASGASMLDEKPRHGLDGWKIQDLSPDDFCGVPLQFTQTDSE